MELIDKKIIKMDFLIGLSSDDIENLFYILQRTEVLLDEKDPLSVKAHHFFVHTFFKFILDLKEEIDSNGIGSDRS